MGGLSVIHWLILFGMGGGPGLPLGVPPLPEDPVLAQMAPQECLLYLASSGTATPVAKSTNQTEQLFAEPEVKKLVAEVERLLRAQLAKVTEREGPQAAAHAKDAVILGKVLLERPLALAVSQMKIVPNGPPDIRASAMISVGDNGAKIKEALERLQAALPPGSVKPVTIEGETFHRIALPQKGPEITWGLKGQYLYAAVGSEEMEALLKRAKGTVPEWLTTLRKQLPVERISTVCMVNVKGVIGVGGPEGGPLSFEGLPVAKIMKSTGLDGVERVSQVTGLDKNHFVNRSLITLPGEPKGLLQLLSQKPLTAEELALLPRDATFASAGKVDVEKAYTTILDVVDKIEPQAGARFRAGLATGGQALGINLVDDILKPLGDTIWVFDSPSGGGLFTGVTAVMALKDPERAAATHQKLLGVLEKAFNKEGGPNPRPQVEKITFAKKTIYILQVRERGFLVAPSWCLTDKHLIVSLYPQAIKAFLARGSRAPSLTQEPAVEAALAGEGELLKLTYLDTRRIFDLVYPFLTVGAQALATELQLQGIDVNVGLLPSARSIRRHLGPTIMTVRRTPAGLEITSRQTVPGGGSLASVPIAMGLLIPAVQKVREAAARTQSMNNLKQIALAMHNYHATNGTFPPAYKADKNGKPLLSWRVLILPYIEQQNLYQQFHLDKPWDSEHNKQWSAMVVKVYRSPMSQAPLNMTTYLTVRGKNTAFPGAEGIKLTDITDGTSNTIMIVEASDKKAVPWAKPDDFEFNEKKPGEGLRRLLAPGIPGCLL